MEKKIPLFYTPHGYSFLMEDCSKLKRFLYKGIEIICGKRRCMTICCSKGEYEESLGLTKMSLCIDNGINIQKLNKVLKTVSMVKEHPFTVFTLGRICYQKNPKQFNAIASALPDIHFLWIGDGELRAELTSPNIEITGWLNRQDALSQSLSADVFILTSLWEGLPISLLEAMYMKKFCIVSDVIGNHDVIINNKNGCVCSDTVSFIEAILKSKNLAFDELRENAYRDVEERYNVDVMANKYKEVYKNYSERGIS